MRSEDQKGVASGLTEGARRATGVSPEAGAAGEPLGPGQRWSVGRKREVVLRLLRGEPVETLSREVGVEIYRLEKWKERALGGIDTSLRERGGDPLERELDAARQKIGERSMEIELLRLRCRSGGPLARGRSRN